MNLETWLLSIITLILGWGLGLGSEWFRGQRDRETRRKRFQFDTITEAQDLMGERFRLEGGPAVLCQRYFDETGKWPDAKSSAITYDQSSVVESTEAAMRLVMLRSRIEDAELDRLLDEIVSHSTAMTAGPDSRASLGAVERTETAIHAFNDRARVVLADLH